MRLPPFVRSSLLLVATAGFLALASPPAEAHGRHSARLVGYFIQWGIYGKGYVVKSAEDSGAAARLTHLQYAFAMVTPDLKCGSADAWADFQKPFSADQNLDGVDETWSNTEARGNFGQLIKLKALHPDLKVLISIGGYTFSDRFSDAALTPESREAFVASCVDMFIRGNVEPGRSAGDLFDGIDIDWEYPGSCGATCNFRPEDTQNFTALMAEFRRQLDLAGEETGKRYELAMAAPAPQYLVSKYDLPGLSRSVDYISLMAYDLHGQWEMQTNFHSPLFPSPKDPAGPGVNAHAYVNAFLAAGVPASKLVLGEPFYGRGWQGVPNVHHGLYQSATGPAPAPAEAGVMDYRDIAPIAAAEGSFHDFRTQGHWIYNPTTGVFWGYDNALTAYAKGTYVKVRRLGGSMFWELSQDSANGTLVRALHQGLH
jgi:chitinase